MSAESSRPEVCVGAVVVSDDALLMIRRGHGPAAGRWSIPSGRVEHGETLAEATVRELAEETGLNGVCSELVGWAESISDLAHFVVFNFEVILLDDTDPVAGSDAAEVQWVPLHAVDQYRLIPGLAEFLHDHGIIEIIT
ncbi:MAG: NUDIX domain-containing protein [Microthrixaceae bacterium]|nr:NUDIX domain-containing protein [Microthrixaceae bacterium]MCO5312916.1 NUDIX domain-containing protein [Microthrixaceae bacterium]